MRHVAGDEYVHSIGQLRRLAENARRSGRDGESFGTPPKCDDTLDLPPSDFTGDIGGSAVMADLVTRDEIRLAGKRAERQNEMTIYAPFDVADYLDNDEVVAEYLSAATEDPDPAVFLAALSDVAKARGVGKIADDTGPEPEGSDTIPRVAPSREAVNGLLRALGMRLVVVADRGPS